MTNKSKLLGGASAIPAAATPVTGELAAPAPPWNPPAGAVQWLGDEALDMTGNGEALAPVQALVPFHRWDFSLGRGLYIVKHPYKPGRTELLDPGDWIELAGHIADGEHCEGQPLFRVFTPGGTERLSRLEIEEARNARVKALGRELGRESEDDLRLLAEIEERREHGEDVSFEAFGAVGA